MEKFNRKILISMIIVIIIIIVITILLLIFNNKKNKGSLSIDEISTVQPKDDSDKIEEINEITYYNVVMQVRKFYGIINRSNYMNREGISFAEDENVKRSIYNLLSDEYISRENIIVDSVYEHIPEINEATTFIAIDIKRKENGNIEKFLVQGVQIVASDTKKDEDVSFFVNIDSVNKTFSIEPIKQGANEDIEIKEIQKNQNNNYEFVALSEEEIAKEKFNNLKLLLLRKSKELYKMFDKEYRNKKFGNYQGYVQYVEDNYERLSTMYMAKYRVKEYDDYKQYICLDKKDNYFIFNVFDSNNTKIMLDTYTVDLPEFVEKYNKANDSTKVGYNIERFISAVNDKDYKYAYNCLDEVYRKNNMPTLENFENYIKRNLYDKNKVEYESIEKQGNNYIYEITIKDQNNSKSEQKKMTVIMKLEKGTDFVMSFNMD